MIIVSHGSRRCVLGIDPGLLLAGYAVLECGEGGKGSLLDLGYLQQSSDDRLVTRVGRFYQLMRKKSDEYGVTDLALETPYFWKNAQTFLKLGYLRGVVHLLAHEAGLGLHEFTPSQIKQAVTGSGRAEKDQVARALLILFPRVAQVKAAAISDVTDALGVALCGALSVTIKHF